MKTSTLNTENGDTVIITIPGNSSNAFREHILEEWHRSFNGQNIKFLLLPTESTVTLVKSSNLDDNYDADIRKGNEALEDAWQAYQTVKGLTIHNGK